MNNRSKNKGFTIVELVIVIAVIAILAAVLIPTFSSIINKAKESKLLQEAKNAYTEYMIDHAADTTNQSNMLYYTENGTIVALKQGSPLNEVFTSEEDAIKALMGDANDYTVKDTQNSRIFAVVPVDETEGSVPTPEPSQPSETPDEPDDYEDDIRSPIQCGNRFGGPEYENDTTRICTPQNIRLKAGTIIIIKQNDKYDWALSKESNAYSTTIATDKYYFSSEQDNAGHFRIVESGYYGFTVKSIDNTEFDTSCPETNDLYDFFEIVEGVGMYYGNKFINDTTDKTSLYSAINLYLPAGTEITFNRDTEMYEWAVSKTESTSDSKRDYITEGGWTSADIITIKEAGYYGFVVKGKDTLDEGISLFEFFTIPEYAVG